MMRRFKEDLESYVPINIREFLQHLSYYVLPRRSPRLVVDHPTN